MLLRRLRALRKQFGELFLALQVRRRVLKASAFGRRAVKALRSKDFVLLSAPRRSKVRFAPFFFAEKHPPAALLLLFRKRSRQVARLTCKRVRCRLVTYQPFSVCAFGA